jgi:hypothetical protein
MTPSSSVYGVNKKTIPTAINAPSRIIRDKRCAGKRAHTARYCDSVIVKLFSNLNSVIFDTLEAI